MPQRSIFWKTWLACIVLGAGLLATVFASLQVKQRIEQESMREFDFACDQITLKIQERLGDYALILRGGATLFAASQAVERNEWHTYVEKLRAEAIVPGAQGIGFAPVIPAARLTSHITRIRAEGFPDYTVRPSGVRAIYAPVTYIEPFRGHNLQAFGFDMYSEPVRQAALEQARDTAEAALSGKIELLQETGVNVQAGFLMTAPVYRNGAPVGTLEQRRAALSGWIYSPYRMNDFMAGIFRGWSSHQGKTVHLNIYDGLQTIPAALLFDSEPDNLPELHSLFNQQRTIDFNDHQWLLVFQPLSGEPSTINYTDAWATLAGGLSFSALLFGLMLLVINTKAYANRIAGKLTQNIKHSHELLEESEFRWKFALEGAGDGLLDWNIADNTLFFSKIWKEMLGFGEDEIGNGLEELTTRIHPEDMANAQATLQDYLDGNTPVYVSEYRIRCKDGSYKWIIDRGMIVSRGEDGKPLRMISTHRDITKRKLAEEKLRVSEERLKLITKSAQDAIIMLDETGNIVFWNKAAEKMFGYSRKEILGRYLHTILTPLPFREAHLRAFPHFQKTGKGAAVGKILELAGLRKDGSEFPLELSLSAVQVKGTWQSIGIVRDITGRKQAEEKLQLASNVFTHAREGIMITAADGTIIDVNDAFCDITSYSRDEVLGKNPRLLGSSHQETGFYAAVRRDLIRQGHWYGELWNQRKNGEVYAVKQSISAVKDAQGNIRQYVALISDITPIKEHEKQLEYIAHYDALTGLPNRVLLADRLHQGMAQTRRRGLWLAVAFLDLDGFKPINDNYGHEAGDQLLIAAANNMKQTLREGDTIARLGGDEFVTVLHDLADIETSIPMLTRLLDAAARPVQIGEISLQVSASLGVTFYPQEEDIDADQLLRQADQAMYQAKLAGKNRYHIFDAEQDSNIRGHHESLERIRRALTESEFVLYYQPKVNMRTGTVIGAEALIRWRHPERGLLPPDLFLPVINNHPLSVEVGNWVIDSALTQMALWHAAGLDIQVSVNVGARQLQQTDFVERLRAQLDAHPKVMPCCFELEVLETSALEDIARVSQVIEDCREIGVLFALDDFGTGYSSLTYLKRLPVAQLKIDQSFVRDMLEDPDNMIILEAMFSLATALRRQVIAEGVATMEHGKMLLQLGCDLAQGYFIAHPMPAHELPGWSAAWRPDPAWGNLPRVKHDDLPLHFASFDHRAWTEAVEAFLKGQHETPPPLDIHLCRFGQWLDAEGLAHFGAQPNFQTIELLHEQVHALASKLCVLHEQDRNPEALAKLGELHDLRDALLEQLTLLQQCQH